MASRIIGEKEVLDSLDGMAAAVTVAVGCASEGYRDDGIPLPLIWNSQAKQGRVPYFLTDAEDSGVMGFLTQMIDAWADKKPGDVWLLAKKAAAVISDAVKRNINEGRSEDGPMKPLTERYKAIKKWTYHAEGKPILVRSGQLLASLGPNVRVGNR